jgi:PAS domain S-box-containing protein
MKSNLLVIAKRQRNGDRSKANSALDGAFFLSVNNVNTSIAENSIDMIFRFRLLPVYRLTFVSPSCQRITGYTPEEYYADPELIRKTVHPEDWNLLQEFINPVNACNRNSTILRWLRKDGSVIWTEQSLTFIHDERGEPTEAYIIARDISERKMAEEALRASEEKFSKVFNSSLNAICIVTVEGETILDINDSFTKFTGYTREEIIGHHAAELNIWVNKEEPARLLETLIENGRLYNFEINSRMKSGEVRTVLLSAEIINIAGKPCMILVITDITEQKRAEDALKENEEFTASLLMNTPTPIFVTYPDTSIKYANPAFEKLTGYSLNDISGMKSPYPWWPEETRHEIQARLKNSTFGDGVKKEMAYRKKNGEPFWVELNATVIHQNGEKRYIVVAWVDITERKQMEMALRESEEKFSKAFNASPSIMSITTPDGKYVEVNESFLRISGLSREEAIGRSSSELNIWANPEEHIRFVERIKEQGHIYNEEFRFRGKTGDIQTVLFSAEQINIGGEPCLISVSNDISERKHAEKSLKESEEKFSKAFTASANAICITSLEDNKFIEVNESYSRFTGYTREEVIGRTATELNLWVYQEELEEFQRKVEEEGNLHNLEIHSRKKSGEIRVGLASAEVINISGKPCRIVVITDITERKQVEEALKESEEKFSKVFSASANAISIASGKENRFVDINESFSRFTGYTREEVIGHNANELGLWANEEEMKRSLDTLQKEGRVYNQEFRSRMKSGEIKVGLSSVETINIKGEPCRIVVITDITERKKAERALLESEEKFSKAFLASPDAIAISTVKDGRFIDINESFVRMMGYTRAESIGHTSFELNLWPDEENRNKLIDVLRNQGSIHNELFNFRKKSGEIGLGLFSAEPIVIGNEPCMISVNVNVTQQKKAEEHLRLLGSVTQQVTDSTIVTDPDFKITYMNKAAQELFGFSTDEALGTDISFLDVAPLSKSTQREMRDTLASGKTWTAIIPKQRKDGSIFLCDCKRCPMYDENGRLSSYIIVHHDITEQKEFEEKLKAHKQLIESILTSMPEGVLVTDKSDQIILANEAFRRILHTGRKVIENRPLDEIIHVEQLLNLYRSMKAGNTLNTSLEFRYKVRNQEKIIDCVIIRMGGDRMLLTFTDVSRGREEEDKLYLMDRLASLGEMAAGLAHELNNPLTGILTLSQLLVNSDLPREQKEDIQCVYSEAKRAASIVKNVLLFTRNNNYENGQSSVNEVVKEVLRLREHEESINNISVVTNLQEYLPEILLDKYQLQQVFLNIILNAEAAMKETNRPGILTVTTERVNNHVNIIFTDNGNGIKKHILPRIFDPFFTTKDIGKGTGLGLSICYGIIVKHGGKISVKTQVGEGTTFTIRMPVINTEKRD